MHNVGDRVGPYELVELLAVRPQANLWRASRVAALTRGQREVVLRIVHDVNDPRALAALRQEYDALRALDDPRIRKAHGFYAGFGALALEYVDGVSLTWALQEVKAGRADLDVATVIDIAVEIANALRIAHDVGVVHGRICADTVRLRRDGTLVLTDFAMPLDRLPVLPPELGIGHPAAAATDQWLLAALVCHLLIGEPVLGGQPGAPADGGRDLEPTIRRVQSTWPPLGRWLVKALAPDPRERYGSEGLMLKDLLAALRANDNLSRRDALARRLHSGRAFDGAALPKAETAPPRPESRLPTPNTEMQSKAPERAPFTAPSRDAAAIPATAAIPAAAAIGYALPVRPASEPINEPDPMLDTLSDARRDPLSEARAPIVSAPLPPDLSAPHRRLPPARLRTGDPEVPLPREAAGRPSSYVGESLLVSAVVDEDIPPTPAIQVDEPDEPVVPPRPDRVIPDWAAAWALVLLLAVGLWAVLVRVF